MDSGNDAVFASIVALGLTSIINKKPGNFQKVGITRNKNKIKSQKKSKKANRRK
jgi:hypothetical protein